MSTNMEEVGWGTDRCNRLEARVAALEARTAQDGARGDAATMEHEGRGSSVGRAAHGSDMREQPVLGGKSEDAKAAGSSPAPGSTPSPVARDAEVPAESTVFAVVLDALERADNDCTSRAHSVTDAVSALLAPTAPPPTTGSDEKLGQILKAEFNNPEGPIDLDDTWTAVARTARARLAPTAPRAVTAKDLATADFTALFMEDRWQEAAEWLSARLGATERTPEIKWPEPKDEPPKWHHPAWYAGIARGWNDCLESCKQAAASALNGGGAGT